MRLWLPTPLTEIGLERLMFSLIPRVAPLATVTTLAAAPSPEAPTSNDPPLMFTLPMMLFVAWLVPPLMVNSPGPLLVSPKALLIATPIDAVTPAVVPNSPTPSVLVPAEVIVKVLNPGKE